MLDSYGYKALKEMQTWQAKMQQRPGLFDKLSKRTQDKINSWIPEKVHQAITAGIKQMVKVVLFGSRFTSPDPKTGLELQARELLVEEKIKVYRNTAAVEGGVTGAGGFLAGLADFPLLMAIKIKLLFEIAAIYGFDTHDYRERVYLLHIFELAFSSQHHRRDVYDKMADWPARSAALPKDINAFEWRNFQQEYRDYIDLAKMAQLVPVIGAPVGVIVNYRLLRRLGTTAMNAYRMRLLGSDLPAHP